MNAASSLSHAKRKAKDFMETAVAEINARFGDGYAEKHPELIGSYMQTIATYALVDIYCESQRTNRVK